MTATAEIRPTLAPFSFQRGAERMICAICADTMVAAEASAFSDNVVSYLWTCDTCGHGFVTKHTLKDCPDAPKQSDF
ncbi:MAG: hypothetical protein J0G33_10825 [Afipia felis]|nr:hypothetical protein [Afipia felis]